MSWESPGKDVALASMLNLVKVGKWKQCLTFLITNFGLSSFNLHFNNRFGERFIFSVIHYWSSILQVLRNRPYHVLAAQGSGAASLVQMLHLMLNHTYFTTRLMFCNSVFKSDMGTKLLWTDNGILMLATWAMAGVTSQPRYPWPETQETPWSLQGRSWHCEKPLLVLPHHRLASTPGVCNFSEGHLTSFIT